MESEPLLSPEEREDTQSDGLVESGEEAGTAGRVPAENAFFPPSPSFEQRQRQGQVVTGTSWGRSRVNDSPASVERDYLSGTNANKIRTCSVDHKGKVCLVSCVEDHDTMEYYAREERREPSLSRLLFENRGRSRDRDSTDDEDCSHHTHESNECDDGDTGEACEGHRPRRNQYRCYFPFSVLNILIYAFFQSYAYYGLTAILAIYFS